MAPFIAANRIFAESYVNEPQTLGVLLNIARYARTYLAADGISVAAGTPLKTHLCASAREVCASKPLSTFASPIRQRGVLPAAVSAFAISTPSGKYVLT